MHIYIFIHSYIYTYHTQMVQEITCGSFPAEKPEKLNIKFRLAKEGEVEEGERDGTTFHLLLEPGIEGTDTRDKRPHGEEQKEVSSAPSAFCSASQDGHQSACGEEPDPKPEADP